MKRTYWYILGGVAVVVMAAIAFGSGAKKGTAEVATVTRGTIKQEVSATGKVQSAGRVEMGFEKSGRVAAVNAEVGDTIEAGEVIVSLDNRDVNASVNEQRASVALAQAQVGQYQAALDAERVRLTEIKKGARNEEITLSQTQVDNASRSLANAQQNVNKVTEKTQTDLANVYSDVPDVVSDAYSKVNQAINTDTTVVFRRGNTLFYELSFNPCSQELESFTLSERYEFDKILPQWQAQVQALNANSSTDDLDKAVADAHIYTERAQKLFSSIGTMVNQRCADHAEISSSYATENNAGMALANAAVTAVNSVRQTIEAQRKSNETTLQTAQSAFTEAQNALSNAQSQLELKKASATPEQIAIQEAKVNQAKASLEAQRAQIAAAQARVESAQAQFEKTIIRAPFSGSITKLDIKVGETASPNVPVVGVLSKVSFEIESNIAEVDVPKLQVGMTARVTLDAYGNDVNFDAKITKIDPAETVIDGVSTYKTTFQFDKDDERIRLGMTANVDVQTAQVENALMIPQRAVINTAGVKTVKVIVNKGQKNEQIIDKPVVTGLRGSNGMIEIKEGLGEGEDIVLSL
ncbi:efflux RND transporter periplasmic adaptor subunit [Candidatus Gracilibacteria bacterium]|nr:efflux RND transporter periplasmic adaptor subunit [Candidatus Gracilibacteria bacterium]